MLHTSQQHTIHLKMHEQTPEAIRISREYLCSRCGCKSHLFLVPSMKVISVPEPSLVSSNVPYFSSFVFKIGFPHKGAIAKYPQAALFLYNVPRFHCRHLTSFGKRKREKRSTRSCSMLFPVFYDLIESHTSGCSYI